MRGDHLIRAATRRGLALSAVVLAGLVPTGGSAQAAIPGPGQVNRAGTYNGEVWQTLPRFYIGHIHFIVSGGKIFDLRFTAGALCGSMWAIDSDHAIPEFPLVLRPTGAFSYQGTVAGRDIRIRGKIIGNRVQGTFFQSFSTAALTCTMGQPAAFTATR